MIVDDMREMITAGADAYGSVLELSRRTGFSKSTLDAYLKGERNPSLMAAVTLADRLGFEIVLKRKGWKNV